MYANNALNWVKDTTAHYVETKAECETFGTEEYDFQNVGIYPNPVNSQLIISHQVPLERITIYDLNGKKLYVETPHQFDEVIDMTNFSEGIYFLKIFSQNHTLTRKIIKL